MLFPYHFTLFLSKLCKKNWYTLTAICKKWNLWGGFFFFFNLKPLTPPHTVTEHLSLPFHSLSPSPRQRHPWHLHLLISTNSPELSEHDITSHLRWGPSRHRLKTSYCTEHRWAKAQGHWESQATPSSEDRVRSRRRKHGHCRLCTSRNIIRRKV